MRKAGELGKTWGGGLGEGPRRQQGVEGWTSRGAWGPLGRGMGPTARVLIAAHRRRLEARPAAVGGACCRQMEP
jgi:hypothetical protein